MRKSLCVILSMFIIASLFGCSRNEGGGSSLESISISDVFDSSPLLSLSVASIYDERISENLMTSGQNSSDKENSTKSIISSSLTKSSAISVAETQIPAYLQSRKASNMTAIKSKITERFQSVAFQFVENRNKYEAGIYLPEFWTTKESGKIYTHGDIIANNIVVGECRVNISLFLDCLDWTIVKEIDSNEKMQVYSMQVKYENASVDIYRAVCNAQNISTFIVIDIRQDAMNLDQFQKLVNKISARHDLSSNKAGAIDYSNKSAKIIILGNSFIGSSEIQSVLQEIISANKKNLLIDVESIGYASVRTFADNEEISNRLHNDSYDFLFLSGFYGNDEVSFNKLMNIKAASTKMVIFPAHNESPNSPYEQFIISPNAGIADWKGFVESLLDAGIDKFRLCINDQFFHSTNLAGYAGACLIYSYLYKSIPVSGTIEARIARDQLNNYGFDYDESIKYMEEIRKKAYEYLYN